MSTDSSVGSSSPIDFSLAPPPLNFVPPEELNNIVFVSEINSRNDSPGESDDDANGSANDVSGSSDNTGEAADLSESMIAIPLPPLVLPPAQLARQLEDVAGSFPLHFFCSLSNVGMLQPMVDQEGNSYEKEAIELYLKKHFKSPVTGNPLSLDQLVENSDLKQEMRTFFNQRPNLWFEFIKEREREKTTQEEGNCCFSSASCFTSSSAISGAKLIEEWEAKTLRPGTHISVMRSKCGATYHCHGLYIGVLDTEKQKALNANHDFRWDPWLAGRKCIIHLGFNGDSGRCKVVQVSLFSKFGTPGLRVLYQHAIGGEAAVLAALDDVGTAVGSAASCFKVGHMGFPQAVQSTKSTVNCEQWVRRWVTGSFESPSRRGSASFCCMGQGFPCTTTRSWMVTGLVFTAVAVGVRGGRMSATMAACSESFAGLKVGFSLAQ